MILRVRKSGESLFVTLKAALEFAEHRVMAGEKIGLSRSGGYWCVSVWVDV
jgi:hypothetical protein